MGLFDRGIEVKTPAQLDLMRRAGLVVAEALAAARAVVRPGVSTAEVDRAAHQVITARGAVPSFLGYHGFPAATCISVGAEVVHGIPGPRVLREGELVSVDCGAVVEGWHGDSAVTLEVGRVDDDLRALSRATEEAMWAGLAAMATARRVGEVSAAIEDSVLAHGPGRYGIVEDFTGHGIGSALHQDPDVHNHAVRGRTPRLVPGLALAVEPMLTLGEPATRTLDDDWTAVTLDGSAAAHWEHTAVLTGTGVWVLTAPDGGEAQLRARGAPYGGRPV